MPLGGLESPEALELSFLEESYAWILKANLPSCFKYLGKLIEEEERVRKDTRIVVEDDKDEVEVEVEVEVVAEEASWGTKEDFTVNEYITASPRINNLL